MTPFVKWVGKPSMYIDGRKTNKKSLYEAKCSEMSKMEFTQRPF